MSHRTDYAMQQPRQDDALTHSAPSTDDTEFTAQPDPDYDPALVIRIPLSQIKRNPYQPRHTASREGLDDLVESIRQYGILQPVLVRQIGPEQYELIAGERRCSAALKLGLETVPAILLEINSQEQAEVALIENLQREDLSPVDMALAFRTLINDFGLSQQDIARKVGKSRTSIAHLLRLLQLPNAMLDSLSRREIQEAHALLLLQIEDEDARNHLFQQVLAEKLSVRETRQRIRAEAGETTDPKEDAESEQPQIRRMHLAQMTEVAIEDELRERYSRRVAIHCPHGKGGYVQLGFRSPTDMIALVDRLLSAPRE
jgi:ParB family transcriptional regulator, chromosome partitioning protein